jgi:3-hydroxyacyl-CoA dehydrogenase
MNSARLLMVGSGKIALDVAELAAGLGHKVYLSSAREQRLDALEKARAKIVRRLERASNSSVVDRLAVRPLQEAGSLEIDAIIEATFENFEAKRAVFRSLDRSLKRGALLASTSSSFLPNELHPQAVGLHIFFPVALTRLAELVLPTRDGPMADAARRLALCLELRTIEQAVDQAFAVNRMLLPWQCEAMRAVLAGVSPKAVDEASRGPWQGLGALSLMDSVGRETVRTAVQMYRSRMPHPQAQELAPLSMGLEASGTLAPEIEMLGSPWATRLTHSLVNGMLMAVDSGGVPLSLMEQAMEAAIGARIPFSEGLGALGGVPKIRKVLDDLHKSTGLSYFRPARRLDDLGLWEKEQI